jgi:hypothetical protein
MQQATITQHLKPGENVIELAAPSDTAMSFQVASRHYIPWDKVPEPEQPPVEITTRYDRTRIHLGDDLRCDVSVRFNAEASFMLMVDLGIPAGFVPRTDDLEALLKKGLIDRYSVTHRQIILYFGQIQSGQRIQFSYRMVPRFVIKTTPPPARAYEYYNPSSEGMAPQTPIEVIGD